MSNEKLMQAAREAVLDRLAAAEEALGDARSLVRGHDDNILQQIANALDDIVFVLTELDEMDTVDELARVSGQLTNASQGFRSNAGGEFDEHAADELVLYVTNDSRFWGPGSQGEALERRYAKLWQTGRFNSTRAADGYMHLLKRAAQQYAKEHGEPGQRWYEMFNVPTRRAAAEELTDQFEAEANLGNFRG